MVYNIYNKSRYEQAPGGEFHPRDKSEKNSCGFGDLLGAIKKVNPGKAFHVVHMKYC